MNYFPHPQVAEEKREKVLQFPDDMKHLDKAVKYVNFPLISLLSFFSGLQLV